MELGAGGLLIYRPYSPQGDTIHDFSHCGYGGGVVLPQVAVKMTLSPSANPQDDLPLLQQAIDDLAKLPLAIRGDFAALSSSNAALTV